MLQCLKPITTVVLAYLQCRTGKNALMCLLDLGNVTSLLSKFELELHQGGQLAWSPKWGGGGGGGHNTHPFGARPQY